MNDRLLVEVTQEDIDGGCEFPRSFNCPLARAINRNLLPGMMAVVGVTDMEIMVDHPLKDLWAMDPVEVVLRLPLPENARQFVIQLDRGSVVHPFTFTL